MEQTLNLMITLGQEEEVKSIISQGEIREFGNIKYVIL
jgi:hypothetical protein